MKSIDTIKLLQECDAGTKMAVASIDNMLDKVGSQQLKNVLEAVSYTHLGKLAGFMADEAGSVSYEGGSGSKPYTNSRPSYGKNQVNEVWELSLIHI